MFSILVSVWIEVLKSTVMMRCCPYLFGCLHSSTTHIALWIALMCCSKSFKRAPRTRPSAPLAGCRVRLRPRRADGRHLRQAPGSPGHGALRARHVRPGHEQRRGQDREQHPRGACGAVDAIVQPPICHLHFVPFLLASFSTVCLCSDPVPALHVPGILCHCTPLHAVLRFGNAAAWPLVVQALALWLLGRAFSCTLLPLRRPAVIQIAIMFTST